VCVRVCAAVVVQSTRWDVFKSRLEHLFFPHPQGNYQDEAAAAEAEAAAVALPNFSAHRAELLEVVHTDPANPQTLNPTPSNPKPYTLKP
jgi:hypothetical protein